MFPFAELCKKCSQKLSSSLYVHLHADAMVTAAKKLRVMNVTSRANSDKGHRSGYWVWIVYMSANNAPTQKRRLHTQITIK
mmetsp:Transcript_7287/g.13630  ORF Transcript_7287/g.13630 Transcript_7287/m.13630 type:complete len:81 (+) Transcript_7287:258-500(+)